jgi:hypothetical protein
MPTILATQVEIGRTAIQGQPGHKVQVTLPQPIKVGHGGAYLSFQLHRKHKQEDCDTGWLGQKCETLFEKYLQQKRARGATQVVECLHRMHETLSTNPNSAKNKTKF